MTKRKKRTLLVFVQDETGSMGSIQDQTISAFNEYFETLKSSDDDLGVVSCQIWQFSDAGPEEERVRTLHKGTLASVPRLTKKNYRPRGVTPLLDAIGTAIRTAEGEQADRYLFISQTDGLENSSRDFTREQVAALWEEKEQADDWTMVALGAGIANWAAEGAMMGMHTSSTMSYQPHQTRAAYASVAGQTVSLLSTDAPSMQGMGAKAEASLREDEKKKTPTS